MGRQRIEILKHGDPRRSKLYYLRKRVGRKATKVKGREMKNNASSPGAPEAKAEDQIAKKESKTESPDKE